MPSTGSSRSVRPPASWLAALSRSATSLGVLWVAAWSLIGPDRAHAGPREPVIYRPPVDAPVVDRFRPPPSPYGPGNRGIDYATVPGTEVRAAAPGEVLFAGPVGGRLHVVVLHADGVRTSYSFLASTAVVRGQWADGGQVLGTAGVTFHFGARVGDAYVDPLLLLAGSAGGFLRLVPDEEEGA